MNEELRIKNSGFGVNKKLIAYGLQLVAAADIRDIRGPLHIPYPWLWLVYVLLGAVAVVLLFLAYRFWKKRKPVVVKLPHEIALERLQQALGLMQPEQTREFSIAVSDAVRLYIEARFQVDAAHRTTEEFLHDLLSGASSSLVEYSSLLEDFLHHCDLAKFARWSLSISEMQLMHQSALSFVEKTKPQEEIKNERQRKNTTFRPQN